MLIGVLTGCQPSNRPLLNEATTVSQPVNTVTPIMLAPTSTAVTTMMSAPPAPTPMATPFPATSLTERGLLLIWDDRVKQYTVLDLNAGNSSHTIRWNPDCEWELLPHATTTVCEHQSGQQYLFDILKETEQDLPIWNAKLIGWDPSGRFLIYSQEAGDRTDFLSVDITTNVTRSLASGIDRPEQERWLTPPALSADGQRLAVVRETFDQKSISVFEITQGGSELRQLGLSAPPATWDIAWSPTSRQLVYGATDIEQEIGPRPNYLVFTDVQTGESQKLGKAPKPLFFWSGSLAWSPTGRQIAVGLWDPAFQSEPQACIIDVNSTGQVCFPALRNVNGHFQAWSPSGEHIAFVDIEKRLTVSNPDGTGAIKLSENVPNDFLLFWR